jgi:hypothetical protein
MAYSEAKLKTVAIKHLLVLDYNSGFRKHIIRAKSYPYICVPIAYFLNK